MITLALLLVCAVEMIESNLEILEDLGAVALKSHWKSLITSWRIEEIGLGVLPVNHILQHWNMHYKDQTVTCVRLFFGVTVSVS